MEKSKKSAGRLNRHQSECNGLSKRVKRIMRIINEIRANTKEMDNIAETYRNKVVEIDRDLEDQSIDFWSTSFELREAIIFSLKEKLEIGLSNMLYITTQIQSIETAEELSKTARRRKNKHINQSIFNFNNANSSIENYDIKDNINETLLTYFLNSEDLTPNNIATIYLKMKENMKEIGIENYYIEPEVLQIISYRKANSNATKGDILDNLYQKKEELVRTRTLQ